jgi:DNA-binding MarR family transcriptional regulator
MAGEGRGRASLSAPSYRLDDQIGFALRKANQRHVSIFARHIDDLTPPQFATLAKLAEVGATSQSQLGTLVAMDAATIKGVIDRLGARGFVSLSAHEDDRRRVVVSLSDEGQRAFDSMTQNALAITRETVAALTERERQTLMRLLAKIS